MFRALTLQFNQQQSDRDDQRGHMKVQISDPSRTLVDLLNYPDLGGGMRHIAKVLREYVESPHKDVAKLLEYIERLDNRTIYKRLGYLLEALEIPHPELLEACRNNLSAGYSLFDPTAKRSGPFRRRWGLRVNVNVKEGVGKK
jgi:predicted transcriptional regulator of viral defense system